MRCARGQTLIAVYAVVMGLTVIGGGFLTKGMTAIRHSDIQTLDAQALFLAQGGADDAITQFMNAIANFTVNTTATCYPDDNGDGICDANNGAGPEVIRTSFCAKSAACPSSPYPAGSNPQVTSWVTQAEPAQRTLVNPDGTSVFLKNYQVTTVAPHPLQPGVTVRLHQVVTRRLVYTFQHAIFYDNDLEMLPGPNMTLSGRVHSNSDMYLNSNNTLTVDTEYVHAAGNIYNRRKDSSASMSGGVKIKQAGTSSFPWMSGLDSSSATWTTDSQTRWSGTVKSAVHGVTALAVPTVGSTDPGGFYDTKADIKVVNGVVIQGATPLVDGSDTPPGTVTTSTTFYNNREGKWITMTDLNLKKLAGYYDCNGDSVDEQCYPNHLPSNGLIYATRNNAVAANEPGIRLLKGQELYRADGLTIVSNDPVYVQGDYNTTNKKPSAIIGDAMNLLSTNWQDSKSNQSLGNRVANNTTVNTAFIAGIKTTTTGNYNGGLENYPRFHEDWSGKTISIRGSFVSLWNSQIATGNWIYGAPYYNAPTRNWDYDTDFSSGQMPPFTPWAIEAVRGAWWRE